MARQDGMDKNGSCPPSVVYVWLSYTFDTLFDQEVDNNIICSWVYLLLSLLAVNMVEIADLFDLLDSYQF